MTGERGDALRVAFFTDSFYEVNGVALTSRQFDAFGQRRRLPFLSVHAGSETRLEKQGLYWRYEIRRSGLSFNLEKSSELSFDTLMWSRRFEVLRIVREFRPDLVHVTGPGDFGMLGAWLAHRLRVPLAASWHTNVHEYAARRLHKALSFLPEAAVDRLATAAESGSLRATAVFYRLARVLFAPNHELVRLLSELTGKDCYLMQRGVDAHLYTPERREPGDRPFTIGYVGRLSAEKNVRFLAEVERALLDAGRTDFRFLIAGSGAEVEWLQANMKTAEFLGVIKGQELATAYANMDVFAFPSFTDTFGNVILEAQASGVPPVVTTGGGPKFLVTPGVTGYVAANKGAFIDCIIELMNAPDLQRRMSAAARQHACALSWDVEFEKMYAVYDSVAPRQASSAAYRTSR